MLDYTYQYPHMNKKDNKPNETDKQDGRLKRKKHLNYINGVTIQMCNKIARYEFGNNFLASYKNEVKRTFVMIVADNTEQWQINRFMQFWNIDVMYISMSEHKLFKPIKQRKLRTDKKQLNYINGVTISVLNKIAQYEFGVNFVDSYKDTVANTFIFVVQDKTPDWQVKKFSDYWKVQVLFIGKR